MAAEIDVVRAATTERFGVNVFVPGAAATDCDALAGYLDSLAADAEAVDAMLGAPSWDDDGFDEKTAALLADPPPKVTFTFGCPSAAMIATRPLRAQAAARGDVQRMSLWAGTGFASARDDPAAEVVERLCRPARS